MQAGVNIVALCGAGCSPAACLRAGYAHVSSWVPPTHHLRSGANWAAKEKANAGRVKFSRCTRSSAAGGPSSR